MKDGKGWHQEVANYVSIHHYWGEEGGVILSLSRISYCYLVGISYFYIIVTKLISRDMGNQSMKV
jgi:amino acid permease